MNTPRHTRRNDPPRPAAAFALAVLALAAAPAAAQTYYPQWSSYVGGDNGSDMIYALAADRQTNTFVGGFLENFTLRNSADLPVSEPPYTYECDGFDGFVAKVDSSGSLAWYVVLGDLQTDRVNGLAAHTNNIVYAASLMSWPDPFAGGTYARLTALSGDTGSNRWDRLIGYAAGGTNGLNAVAVDAAGYIYAAGYTTVAGLSSNVAGYVAGGVTYGTALKGLTDAFVAKYAPNGNRLWLHYLGGTNADAATCCALGPGGALYVGGETRSPGWCSTPGPQPSAANPDGFVVALTTNGAHRWSACFGGPAADAVAALARDAATNALYLGGATASATNFVAGATRLNQPSTSEEGFVLRLADLGSSFQTNWCRFAGGASADRVNALALQPDGALTAAGDTASSGWLPAAVNTYRGGLQDGFLLRLGPDGGPLWSVYAGGARSDGLRAVATPAYTLRAGGETRSPDNTTDWVSGGFWPNWTKTMVPDDPDAPPDYAADLSYGLLASWSAEQGDPPTVTDPPDDLAVNEGASATFQIAAAGYAPLSYRWFRNGQPLTAGPTSNLYALAAAGRTNNQDVYTCLVSNLFGTAVSPGARLTVVSNASLTVTLAPAAAVAQGARWRLAAGGAWLASGASTNLPPGAYGVAFTNLAGWSAPAALTNLALLEGRSVATSGVYAAVLPAAARAISGTNVSVTVRAPAGLVAWTLVESLPPGLAPTNIVGGGAWNGAARTLTFTGAEATTGTVSYVVLCATSGVYTVSGAVTAQPSGQSVVVTGDATITKANVVRTISGRAVTITMVQPTVNRSWYVNEYLPAGLAPTNAITGPGGVWIEEEGMIYWGTYGKGQTLTYEVCGAPGTYTLSGFVSISGVVEPIFGDTQVVIAAPEPPPAPAILAFAPVAGTNAYALAFTSVVDQAYVILTNAAPGATNGWAVCLPVTGEAGTTQRTVPAPAPRLFYRVRTQE